MENGVALIDIGAGVSSVTIFKGKIMRYYAAIPFGGNSITNDIKSECNFSFDLAESIKKAFGACMPNKLSALGEKSIQIVDENEVPTAQVSVKYISEIITARMKEIIEALLFEIQQSGYAAENELRAGVVVTGGGAELVNCANYIKELSGYSVKIGYPRRFFSCEGCPDASEATAATSMGMILAAKGDRMLNCVKEAPGRRVWTAPAPSTEPAVPVVEPAMEEKKPEQDATRNEIVQEQDLNPGTEPVGVPEPAIEQSVLDAQDYGSNVFDEPTDQEIKKYREKKKEKKVKSKPQFTWFKHIQKGITQTMEGIFDQMGNEEI